jgi:gliding motility associated protien GldN
MPKKYIPMRKPRVFVLVLIALLIAAGNLTGQVGKVEVYEKTHIPKKDPVPYRFTREADVMWSKTIWRILDLKEKMNLPLYYPTISIGSRSNLIKLLTESAKTEGTKFYDPIIKTEFTVETAPDEVNRLLGAGKDSTQVDGVWKYTQKEPKYEEVTKLLIKELWFFNKQYSSIEVRILGLCPIRLVPTRDANGDPTGEIKQSPLFWVYYPDVRKILASNVAYNTHNDAQNISYDDLFWQRRFSSYIFKESNSYDNRQITDYSEGMDVLYESDRIKESIFIFEHDLWEY